MQTTPKSLRLQIGILGRMNVGKSSFLNMMASQDVAITSAIPGTTTDIVEKSMELVPLGPVVFLDTAGINDQSELGTSRIEKTKKIFDRADTIILLIEPNIWTETEEQIVKKVQEKNIALIIAINKIDTAVSTSNFMRQLKNITSYICCVCATDKQQTENYRQQIKQCLLDSCPDDFLQAAALIGDLLPAGGLAILIVPIDLGAPKGRLILPQVQTIRDALDNDSAAIVVKEREYANLLTKLTVSPDIVICDSQVVLKMVADTPKNVKCTTFSILFSRYKGDLAEMTKGAKTIDTLKENDRILIAESCSHHALQDDIGRVKIPRWLKQYAGVNLKINLVSGRDFPENLTDYKLIVQCGSCMLGRKETLSRIQKAREANVPITNYGICISHLQGVLKRVLSPFPSALNILD